MLPYISIPFQYVAGKMGASTDELKLIFSVLLSYPLAGLLKRIPDSKPAYKNLFIIGISLFYLVGLFDLWVGCRTIAISSIGTYLIAKYIDGPFMPWIGFVFLMVHMSINQIHRQNVGDPGAVDVTGAQMVMVMKLSAFCWNVADGRLPEKDLSDFQKERQLKQLPSLLDYAGWVLFFPALFAGPAFDYADYRNWLDASMFAVPAGVDPSKRPPTRKLRKIPRSGTPAAWKAAAGLLWIVAFLQASKWVYAGRLTGPDYMSHGFLKRAWLMYLLGLTTRFKFYGVWFLAEGACILSGLGYRGVDPKTGKVSWDRLQNVSPWGVETAQNTRAYLAGWNMNTNNWLRNYIYLRVTPRGQKPGFGATMATFVTSAFWHGFYPGYYLTFVLASFAQAVAKNFRRYVRPFFLDPINQKPTPQKIYYDIFSYLVTQFAFSFITAPFVILGFTDSIVVWSRVYFYAVIGTAAAMAFFASPGKIWLKKQLGIRAEKAGSKLKRTYSQESVNSTETDPLLGLLPQQRIDEVVEEIRAEVEMRQRNGVFRSETM